MTEALLTPTIQQFIQEHRDDDPVQLALQARKYPDIPMQWVAHQIKCYQKAKSKIPAFAEKSIIIYPPGISLEQSSSEATAQYKARLIQGNSVTDLTAGFGIDTYYLSQHIETVIALERNPDLIPIVNHNWDVLGVKNITYHQTEAETYLSTEENPTDLYFIDPARRDDVNHKLHLIEDCQPNLLHILPALMERKAEVWIKLSPLLDIHQALEKIAHVAEVHVVSVQNECKELLLRVIPNHSTEPIIHAVNLTKQGDEILKFCYSEESDEINYNLPLHYLYEPNASIMKAGGFKAVARKYALSKLHRNSHLYTSDELVPNFPGRSFKIEALTVLNKKKLKTYLPANKANITVRNYPNTIQEIRKKTSIKDGGSVYLFATTLMDGSPKVLVCSRV
ncbi:THUMP-like domain-containing protein [Reichenbachiella agariperforans]|uniref:THUMP-like domain-containing protein n=1 Tax=Reichenbachiella agariperforans TaxID=156994 RepID=UPI001C081C24|nr:hypothetical protein [Reichenbachiella agariperforans]MBU2915460.1 hypothetical protein [Reichenbachiella agariperforans]